MKEKIKCFACLQGISKWKKKHALFLQTQTSNFQTDSLKAHEVNEASEVHVMTSAAKHTSERPREERPLPTLPAALSRLKPRTAVELIKLLLLLAYMCIATLICYRQEVTEMQVCCYVSLKGF